MQTSSLVQIGNCALTTKEYHGERVVTFRDIDAVHERPSGAARKGFFANKKHFSENTDFFRLTQASEIRTFGGIRPQGGVGSSLTLITESGYLMLVKSFTDDLAWEVQRQLVKNYFRIKAPTLPAAIPEPATGLSVELKMFKALYDHALKTESELKNLRADVEALKSQKVTPAAKAPTKRNGGLLSTSAIAKKFGLTASAANCLLRNRGILKPYLNGWTLTKPYAGEGYMEQKVTQFTENGRPVNKVLTDWTPAGQRFLRKTLRELTEVAS